MKKILLSFTIVFLFFQLLSFPLKVSACNICTNPTFVSFHYTSDAQPIEFTHRSFGLNVTSCSAPIYDIYFKVGDLDYVVFLSSEKFTYNWKTSYGSKPECGEGGGSNPTYKPLTGYYYLVCLDLPGTMYPFNFTGWETYDTSRIPSNTIADLPDTSDTTIRSIDTSGMTPLFLSDGSINNPEPFDPFSAEYDDDVPVPQVITKFNVVAGVTTPIISFTNGSTDYNVVIYGRWNSINDITLRQEKLRWVYDYSSLIHGDLECWVSDEDNRTSRENFDFFSDPHFTDTYQAFLLKYPLAERNITNDPSLFEKLTGYNEALHNFTELYMNLPNNAYSKPDFFFRYYYRDEEQNIHYSRWAHLTFPLIPPGENGFKTTTDQLWKGNLDYQIANKPLTSEEVLDVDTYFDTDQTKYNIMNNQQSYDLDQIDWTMSLSNLQSITSVFGQMPAFVATVFSCYPAWMVQLIGATITILCALAIYHGIRG